MISLKKPFEIKLNLTIECNSLKKLFFKQFIQPYLVIKTKKVKGQIETVFTSEVQKNNYSPIFNVEIGLEYQPQQNQKYFFQIFQFGQKSELIGSLSTTIGEILTAPKKQLVRPLNGYINTGGSITIKHLLKKTQFVQLKFVGQQTQYKNLRQWFTPSILSFKLMKVTEKDAQLLHQSQVLQNSCNKYGWKQFVIQKIGRSENQLGEKTSMILQLYSGSENSKTLVGFKKLCPEDLYQDKIIYIANHKQETYAKITISKCSPKYSFYELIEAGLELNLMMGIDFSASNKVHNDSKSLHNIQKGKSTYHKAIEGVSKFILGFTPHKDTPVYGFGTKVKHPHIYTGKQVQQCFPLTADFSNPQIEGLQKISQAYLNTLPYFQFSGPTKCLEIINKAIKYCKERRQLKPIFTVLAILTDGQISDKQQVKQLLLKTARMPMLIIFVGIGNGSFEDIIDLCSVKSLVLVNEKENAQRESMIKYVNFTKCNNDQDELSLSTFREVSRIAQQQMEIRKQTPELIKIGNISQLEKKPSDSSTIDH